MFLNIKKQTLGLEHKPGNALFLPLLVRRPLWNKPKQEKTYWYAKRVWSPIGFAYLFAFKPQDSEFSRKGVQGLWMLLKMNWTTPLLWFIVCLLQAVWVIHERTHSLETSLTLSGAGCQEKPSPGLPVMVTPWKLPHVFNTSVNA